MRILILEVLDVYQTGTKLPDINLLSLSDSKHDWKYQLTCKMSFWTAPPYLMRLEIITRRGMDKTSAIMKTNGILA